MTCDNWKATNPDDMLLRAIAEPDKAIEELELVYGALHHALEAKCALIKALQQIEDVLEPGRWTLVKLHDARRIARDAIATATCKVNP